MILLDTHAWVWWLSDPERLPPPARAAIDDSLAAGHPIRVSSISVWEVAMLVHRGRLELTMTLDDWLAHAEAAPEIAFVPVDNRIAAGAVGLDGFAHEDPADRIVVATALMLGATLVTADARLRDYAPLPTLWD